MAIFAQADIKPSRTTNRLIASITGKNVKILIKFEGVLRQGGRAPIDNI
jgi:hypothetical protein